MIPISLRSALSAPAVMPRDLSLSNRRLLVHFDDQYYLWDLYWPHVGRECHAIGISSGLAVSWLDGHFSWIADSQAGTAGQRTRLFY